MKRELDLVKDCHPEQQLPSLRVEGRLYSIKSWIQKAIDKLVGKMSFPKFSIGNLNLLRPPIENFGGDKEITSVSRIKKPVRMTSFYFLHAISLSSLFLLFFLLTNCSNKLPEEIISGEHKCEFCKMGVVNQNYQSQVLTKKGRRFHFDSIECMFSYWNKNFDKIEKVWVKDFQHPKDWIEIQNAKFLKADKLPSPMAANLSSYKSNKEAEDNRLLYGGTLMTQEEVMDYVKTNWEKELAGKGK